MVTGITTLSALKAIAELNQAPVKVRLRASKWDAVMREVVADFKAASADGTIGYGQRWALTRGWKEGVFAFYYAGQVIRLVRVGPPK